MHSLNQIQYGNLANSVSLPYRHRIYRIPFFYMVLAIIASTLLSTKATCVNLELIMREVESIQHYVDLNYLQLNDNLNLHAIIVLPLLHACMHACFHSIAIHHTPSISAIVIAPALSFICDPLALIQYPESQVNFCRRELRLIYWLSDPDHMAP